LEITSLGNGQQASCCQLAGGAAVAEANLAPLHTRAERPFCAVVGREHQIEARRFELQAHAAQELLKITRTFEDKLPDADAVLLRNAYRWARNTLRDQVDVTNSLNELEAEGAKLRQLQQQYQRSGTADQMAELQRQFRLLLLRYEALQAQTLQGEAGSIAALIDVTRQAEDGFVGVAKAGLLEKVLKKEKQERCLRERQGSTSIDSA
jgi:hypothetical protein